MIGADAAARAEALLREAGLAAATVRAVGFRGQIAAVRASAAELPRLAELAPQVKRLGFRYVALELPPAPQSAGGAS